jgi:hypothetical protein
VEIVNGILKEHAASVSNYEIAISVLFQNSDAQIQNALVLFVRRRITLDDAVATRGCGFLDYVHVVANTDLSLT